MLWDSYSECLMHSLISLVSDSHMDNNRNKILVYGYFGSFVNN